MELTPEQREIGKHNFYESIGSTRRDFLKGTLAAGAVAGGSLGAMYFGYGATVEDPVRVGIIGTGDEGGVLIGALNPEFVDVVAIADIRPYNLHRAFHGHVKSPGTLKARPGLINQYGWGSEDAARDHVKVYKDNYEELLDDPDVEAVIIALPLWLHDVAAIKAMRKGKHVLTEKLMGHSVAQCKEMGRVADDTGLLLATGHQRHYSVLYDNAVDQIKRGLLGDVHHIRAQWHRGGDSWMPPIPCKLMSEDEYIALRRSTRKNSGTQAEAALRAEYNLLEVLHKMQNELESKRDSWPPSAIETAETRIAEVEAQLRDSEVEAAEYGYESKSLPSGYEASPLEELIRWRLWDRTGGGLMAELGSHQLDAASIFISSQRSDGEKVYPLAVQSIGHRSTTPANREVNDHVYCSFEFPARGYYKDEDYKTQEVADPEKKVVVTYSSLVGSGFGGYGEVVLGTKGTLVLANEKEVLLYKDADVNTKVSVKKTDSGPVLDTYETGGAPAALAQAAMPKEVSRGYREEIEHWAWCIRNPDPDHQPKCKPKVALADAVIALTSNIAMRKQKRIEFDPKWFDINDDATPDGEKPRQADELS